MIRVFFLIALLATLTPACVNPPDYSDSPVIEFKSMSANTLRQTPLVGGNPSNEITLVTIRFTDGDGDLGFNDSSSFITVADTRITASSYVPEVRNLPLIDHQSSGNGISGELTFEARTSCCINPPVSPGIPPRTCDTTSILLDTLTLKIQMRDKAGHLSNILETPPIILICRNN